MKESMMGQAVFCCRLLLRSWGRRRPGLGEQLLNAEAHAGSQYIYQFFKHGLKWVKSSLQKDEDSSLDPR